MAEDEFADGYVEGFSDEQLRALSRVYYERLSAGQLLERAGLERTNHPNLAGTSGEYWKQIDSLIREGGHGDLRQRVLDLAAEGYPANPVFRAAATAGGSSRTTSTRAGGSWRTASSRAGGWFDIRPGRPGPATILVLDAVAYSKRGTLVQLAVRGGLREIVDAALSEADIPSDAVVREDRGDGYLAVVSPAIDKPTIVSDFARELEIALRDYNRTRNELGQIRLRLGVHHGEVVRDGTSWAGGAIVVAARLVDSPPVREALIADPDADLAMIVSPAIFDDVVRERYRGLDPSRFRKVLVQMEKFEGDAWLTLPGRGLPPREPAKSGDADRPGGSGGSAPAESRSDVVKWDFFVLYAEDDEKRWGEWIAWHLSASGYRVHLETWNVRAGTFETWALDDAVRFSKRTIIVLSPAYLESDRVRAAWGVAWQSDPGGLQRTLIPVRVDVNTKPEGLLGGIRYIDLAGLDDEAAHKRLNQEIERSVAGYYRPPTPPPFPGD